MKKLINIKTAGLYDPEAINADADVIIKNSELVKLRAKLAIAIDALKRADALFADDRQRTNVINEALERIEKL